jgi:hypothetical protein
MSYFRKHRQKGLKAPTPARKKSRRSKSFHDFCNSLTPHFFCAALTRNIRTHPQRRDKKARLRLYVKSAATGKHGTHPQGIIPTPARRVLPAGVRKEGLILTPFFPAFLHKP